MANIPELVDGLNGSDHKVAYQCLQQLEKESDLTADVYPFFNVFVELLSSPNSYLRTRGIILIAANAKWDSDNKIDEIMDSYLKHIADEKPITARQCIQALPTIAIYKPELREDIKNALLRANSGKYAESMQSLVQKDIQKALSEMDRINKESKAQ